DPFDAGELLEVQEIVEYVEVKTLHLSEEALTQKKTRAKAIKSGKYAKNRGEK
ncbi:5162_t:CDS:1, partial [Entrophospora sp. SA101]